MKQSPFLLCDQSKSRFKLFVIVTFCSTLVPGDTMELPRPPAFMDPSLDEDMIMENGVNFASGGGGILNETATYFVSSWTRLTL